jgi:hypothetical protein
MRRGARLALSVVCALAGCAVLAACSATRVKVIRPSKPVIAYADCRLRIVSHGETNAQYERSHPPESKAQRCRLHYDIRDLLGLPIKLAAIRARSHGYTIRVIEEDGKGLMHTLDFLFTRIEVATRHGIVVSDSQG